MNMITTLDLDSWMRSITRKGQPPPVKAAQNATTEHPQLCYLETSHECHLPQSSPSPRDS